MHILYGAPLQDCAIFLVYCTFTICEYTYTYIHYKSLKYSTRADVIQRLIDCIYIYIAHIFGK